MKAKSLLYLCLIFLFLIVGVLFLNYTIEKNAQQNFVNRIRGLGDRNIAGLEIMPLHPIEEEQGKRERKALNHSEIALVKGSLKNIRIDDTTFLEYVSQEISRYYKRWFRRETDASDPFDDPDGPTYSCLMMINVEEGETFEFSGTVYGKYENYEDDLFLVDSHPEKEKRSIFYKPPKPVRIRNLGKWIIENMPPVSPDKVSTTPISDLQRGDLSENLIANGDFNTLENWEQFHNSNVKDMISLHVKKNYLVWERTNSQNDGGSVGVYQNLDVDVRSMTSLNLCLDVWVDYHTLENTGWWSEERGGSGEMPVQVAVLYLDEEGRSQRWNHGFLIHHKAQEVLWLNPETGKREYKSGVTTLQNVTPVPKAAWSHFCFDLMDDEIRKDAKRQTVLPKPARLIRILLYGNGWDFRGAVSNVVLQANRPSLETPTSTPISRRKKLAPGGSSFTFTTHLTQGVPKSHVLRFRENHRVVIITSGDASIEVLDPEKNSLTSISSTPRRFEVLIPRTDYYTIVFRGEEEKLKVTIDISPER